ncbi:MAG TPA: DUF1284 domain-containing protein [bacterium]|jgi:hypothetical protein
MFDPDTPIIIRAHTLLCLQGYQGEGYSPEFVTEMNRVSAVLRSNPSRNVKIIIGADNFCNVCPHHYKGRCIADDPDNVAIMMDSPDKMIEMDKRVLKWLGFPENIVVQWRMIVERISETVDSSSMDWLCQDCSWRKYPFCSNALDALNRKYENGEELFPQNVETSSGE